MEEYVDVVALVSELLSPEEKQVEPGGMGVGRLGPGKADGSKYNAKNYREYREKRGGEHVA